MRSKKKSFLMSLVSLLLCVAMLVGSTFAWFTDTVTSGTNKIVAGNLDVEVSYKDGDTWKTIEGADSLFDKAALWEPGHTEYVTLKVENKGTLALKYQLNVSPITETGGINMAGQSFKLSDYLMFGTANAEAVADRAAARALVAATATGLNQAELSKGGEMAVGADAQYITLVVYMPENVGNEVNYKTGTTAPEINLGITVVATQLQNESDSFNTDYDKNAVYDHLAAVYTYNYFPQTKQVAQLKKSTGDNPVAQKDGEDNHVEDDNSKITIKSDAEIANNKSFAELKFGNNAISFSEGSNKATVTFNAEKKAEGNFTVEGVDKESVTFDISASVVGGDFVKGESEKFKNVVIVKFFVGAGKQNVTLKHGEATMTKVNLLNNVDEADEFFYDENSGYITMAVDHFSEFTTECNAPVAAVGTTAYYSLKEAAKKAEGKTVFVVRDTEEENLNLSGVNLDLNGKEVKVTGANVKLPEGMKQDEEGKIVACTHEGTHEQYIMTEAGHSWKCECGETFTEAHDTLGEGGTCSVCGYKSDAALLEENPNYTCRIGNKGYVRPFGESTTEGKASSALKDAQSGDTIRMIRDYTSTNDYYADQKTNECQITLDLNSKTITMKNTFQPAQGIYTIIDSSEAKTGRINKVALYNYQQDSYNTTLNVYAGTIGKISTAVPGSYNVNIYGGNIELIELQDKAKGVNCTINDGSITYVSVYNDMNADEYFVFAEGYALGDEVTGQQKISMYGSEFMANAYKVYTVIKH